MQPQHVYNVNAKKKSVNLTANSDFLSQAKSAGINLSQIFEEAIFIKLRTTIEEQWLAKNRDAIDAYNDRIVKNGVFGANKRRF